MEKNNDPVYSRNVIEFVAVANEFCKYAEQAAKLKGDELLKIFQRILPLMYLKASLLPEFQPVFEDGNEKFITEADWMRISEVLKRKFGTSDDYLELADEKFLDSETPLPATISENLTDIYQDIKNFLLLYQTGTNEVMNDAVWECRMNFENIWGQKLVNSLRAIHTVIYSGQDIGQAPQDNNNDAGRDTSDWILSKRQKEFRDNGE